MATNINDPFKATPTGIVDPFQQPTPATPPAGPTAAQRLSGLGRDLVGSAINVTGGMFESAAQVARPIGRNIGAPSLGSAADTLSATGAAVSDYGTALQQNAPQPYRDLVAGTQLTGEVHRPSTWEFGENPSLTGVASLLAQGVGSTTPTLATGALTRGRLVPSAAAAAASGGGVAAQGERERILELGAEELAALPGYQQRLSSGMTPEQARVGLAEDAASSAFKHTAPVSAADVLSQVLPFTRGAQQALARAVGPGRLPRTAAGFVTGGITEGLQETAEGAAQTLGADAVTGENRPLLEDSLSDAAIGVLTGGLLSGTGAATTSRAQAQAEIAAGEQAPAPVPVEVEQTVVDPAAGPLSRMVATEAAAEMGSPVVTPVAITTPLADEQALAEQAQQQDRFDRVREREARRDATRPDTNTEIPAEAANDDAPTDGVPFFITLAMRRDLADMGYTGSQIAQLTPADAWTILQSAGAESATPDPEVAPATPTTSEEAPDGSDRSTGTGDDRSSPAASESTTEGQEAVAEGSPQAEEGQQGREGDAAEAGAGSARVHVDRTPEPMEGDITPPSSDRFTIRDAAERAANRTPGAEVIELSDGGYVVRTPTEATPDEPEVTARDLAGDSSDTGSDPETPAGAGTAAIPATTDADAATDSAAGVVDEAAPGAGAAEPAGSGEPRAVGPELGDAAADDGVGAGTGTTGVEAGDRPQRADGSGATADATDDLGVGSPVNDGDGSVLSEKGLTDDAQTGSGAGQDPAQVQEVRPGESEAGAGDGAAPGVAGTGTAAGGIDATADDWNGLTPDQRADAIARGKAAGVRRGLTRRARWENLTDAERAALAPIVRELQGATADAAPTGVDRVDDPAGATGDAPTTADADAHTPPEPPSGPDAEPADREATGAGDGASGTSTGGGGAVEGTTATDQGGVTDEPAADPTDSSAPRKTDAPATAESPEGESVEPRTERLEDAGDELVGARSWRNKLRDARTDDRTKDAGKLLDTVTRAAALTVRLPETATPGTARFLEQLRNSFASFTDHAFSELPVWGRQAPRRAVLEAMADDPAVYDQVEQLAAEYMADLSSLSAMLDGAESVDALQTRLKEILFRTPDDPGHWTELGQRIAPYISGYAGTNPRYLARRIDYMAEDHRKGEDKDKARTKPLNRPRLESVERENLPDRRGGKDVTAEDLVSAFGFRGVNYGNYVNAADRQLHTNHAFDALHDLAQVMGIPPKAVSLGGTLGLSIGKEGSGRASAHFEPGTKIINLTKGRGDGSLAHEWGHALSDLLRGQLTSRPAGATKAAQLREHLHRVYSLDALKQKVSDLLAGRISVKGDKRAGARANAEGFLRGQYWKHSSWGVIKPTGFKRDGDVLGKSYWGTDEELWARAFESWVHDRLDGYSPYLVSDWVADGAVTKDAGYRGQPYPSGDERAAFNEAFDGLREALAANADGTVTLAEGYQTPAARQMQAIREWSKWALDNLDTLHDRAAGGHPTAHGLFWYHAPGGRDTGKVPRGYHAHVDNGRAAFVGYPEPLTVEQLTSFKMAAFDMPTGRADIVLDREDADAGNWDPLVDQLYQGLTRGNMPANNIALRKLVAEIDGKPVDGARMKQAQEALETAITRRARDLVAKSGTDREVFDSLLALYQSQPNLNVRTSTSVANQAYSTPAPLAFLAGRLAGVDYGAKVYEPTAGNGMLLIGAAPANVTANELNPDRIASLRAQGFTVREGDALEALGEFVEPGSQDAVVTNPPFDALRDAEGKPRKQKFDGYTLGKLDHLIVADALRALNDDGKATLIIGANMKAGEIGKDDRLFFNWLYSNYNVTGHFEVDGTLYARQGASWPVRVITIHGRVSSDRVTPQPGEITRVADWDAVYERYAEVLGAQDRPIERATGADRGPRTSTGDGAGRGGAPTADGREGGKSDRRRRPGSDRGAADDVVGADAGAGSDPDQPAGSELAEGADGQRPDDAAAEPDRVEPGDGAAADPDAVRPAPRARRPDPAGPSGADVGEGGNDFQTGYETRSARKDTGVLVPVNMAGPLQQALATLEDAVGDLDAFVQRELGYPTEQALHDAFMGLQVDSVASAIYQSRRGKGVIIADQTGIGKGRQAAAMIRWAIKQGMTPVFVTVKPSLFTDMHGDLADIGSTDVAPLILNKDESIKGKDGKALFANKKAGHNKLLENIVETGALPKGRNALFMTYSQINKPNVQRRVLTALADRAFFVLDESHNAGGTSQTGEFMAETLALAKGVTYLSATYAKRPDNMPIYFRTDISDAIEGGSEALVEAMQQGGLPLQTVVANGLVESGQMFRRERSYDGVSIETKVDTANRDKHSSLSDRVTLALRAITEADGAFHEGYVAQAQAEAMMRGEEAKAAGNKALEGVDHSQFSSVVHNFVKQMLLGLKADTAAEEAIATIKAGKKPLIALESTMGSFLAEYAAENGLKDGDLLASFDYRTVLSRALERTRFISRTDAMGDKERVQIPLSQLDANTRRVYEDAQRTIDGLDDIADLPVSPIDWIRHRIEQAGYRVAEITGRKLAVDYSGEAPKLSRPPLEEQSDKVATTDRFNAVKGRGKGKDRLDAIILNVSGSTGISLHASERFGDKRKRRMIVAQPASDINIFMQMLGRVHRTGQVELPEYAILNVDLPAEKRPTAVLNTKMQSLNANTSSNTDSATSIKSADILNKYGDQIVNAYLDENPELARALNIDPVSADSTSAPEEGLARKATGRLALMPVEVQEAFYADVEQQYNDLIDFLNKTGQNDLVPQTLDFEAELREEQVLVEAKNPGSPFGGEAVYGEYRIKAQGKAMTPEEIRAEIDANLGEPAAHGGATLIRVGRKHAEALIASLEAQLPKRERDPNTPIGQPSPEDAATGAGRSFIRSHPIGSMWRVEIGGDTYNGVVTDLRNTHKGTGNPFSMSKTQVVLALNGPLRQVVVPASQWNKIEVAPIQGYGITLDGAFREQAEGTQIAKIITGNLLAAYNEMRGTTSQIISFTRKDGTVEQGILLPKKFSLEKNTYGDFQLRTPADLIRFLATTTNPDADRFGVASRDQSIRVQMDNAGSLLLITPKSRARGGKHFLNKALLEHSGDFVSSGDSMRATVPKDKAAAALDVIMSGTAIYALPSMAEEARAILSGAGRGAFSRPDPVPTDAPAFRNWFGDSKVVDANGEPLVVYHGTTASFDVFDVDADARSGHPSAGLGVFFTASPNIASQFARDWGGAPMFARANERPLAEGANTMPVYLSIQNPAILTDREFRDLFVDRGSYKARSHGAFRSLRVSYEAAGHDGIIIEPSGEAVASPGLEEYTARQFIAFRPEQIKSATGNRGTFDPASPDILQSRPDGGKRAGGANPEVLGRAVQRVVGQWRGDIPNVQVLADADALPAEAKRERGWKSAEGWYDGAGNVYLIAANLTDVNRGLQVLAHEALGHYGVEAVMGKAQWTQAVGDVAKLRRRRDSLPKDMRAAMDSAVRRYGDANAATFAREFLAILAERDVRSSLTARVLAAVRRWLRSMGFPIDAWAAEELRAIVAAGARQVTRRGRGRAQGAVAAAASERASPFHSAMVEAVEKAQGAPKRADAKAWKGWLDGAQRRGEFKQAERDWLEVDRWLDAQDGAITREAIAGYVRDHQVRIEEVELGDGYPGMVLLNQYANTMFDQAYADLTAAEQEEVRQEALVDDTVFAGEGTRYSDYQLPGGSNYRELLLTLPASIDQMLSGASEFRSAHWSQPNVLAHVRFNERTDADGKRVLFIEEIQSDWHQAGRKRGYKTGEEAEAGRTADAVPDAPLKGTDEWAMLAFKRMVRHAAENGFDRIAWTPGDMQAQRYDLSQQVSEVEYYNGWLNARSTSGAVVLHEQVAEDRIADYIGKEPAERLLAQTPSHHSGLPSASSRSRRLSGAGLKMGGEGMRAFYDKILPSAVNKWAKKLGGRVGSVAVRSRPLGDSGSAPKLSDVHALDLTDAMRSVALEGMPLFSRPEPEFVVLDNRGKELGRGTELEANRIASRMRSAGKRVRGVERSAHEPAFSMPEPLQRAVAAADRITSRATTKLPDRFDAEQAAAAEKFVTFQRREPVSKRAERLKDQAGKRIVQRVFDQFRPLRELDETAFMQAHLSKATDGALEAAFEHGIPVLRDGAFDIGERTGGFKKALSDLGGEHDQFLMWVVGNRAEALQLEGREHLFSEADIRAMKRLNDGTLPDGRDRREAYATALKELQRYNRAMLNIGEKAGVINKEGREVWEDGFYIPFFRAMERDNTGPGQIKGLLRQKVIERLVGGQDPLGDPLENILSNWSHILTASMKNMAATNALDAGVKAGIAVEVEGPQKGAVWAMRNGVEAYYMVSDPFVLEALESLSFSGFDNVLMRAAGKFKHALTSTVTINPSFRIRNLARDVLSAMATTEVGYNPVANVVNGFRLMSTDTDTGLALLAGGGAIRFGLINDGQQAKHAKRIIEAGIHDRDILDTRAKMAGALRRAYDWWQEVGDKSETVNRAAIYDRAIKAGKSHLQASYEARDLVNFTSMGSSAIVRALAQVLPFFNARLQGMDKLARGARTNPARFTAVTGTLALASMALYLLQADDDDYKKLPDYVRDTYWPVKIAGQFVYIPKPFEVGAMATVIERATELAVSGGDYEAKDFGSGLLEIAMSQLAMNPIPQVVRPVTEAAFNYDLFRMAPIDGMGMQNLLPQDRFTARTAAGAVVAGRITGISPQRLEHMVRGYFGWVGTQALNVSDYLLRDAAGLAAAPNRDLSRPNNLFVVGDFLKDPDGISSKYVTRFYDAQKEIDRIYASANLARRTGDTARAADLARSPQMANRPIYKAADKQIGKINQQIRAITNHPTMSAAEKNRRLDALNQRRNAIAMRVDAAVRGRE